MTFSSSSSSLTTEEEAITTKVARCSSSSSSDILAKSWSEAAVGYDKIFVPRFSPWTEDALNSLERALLAHNPLAKNLTSVEDSSQNSNDVQNTVRALVPCCGPGQELVPIAELLLEVCCDSFEKKPSSVSVLGIDLSPGMVDVAHKRIKETFDIIPQNHHHQQSHNENNHRKKKRMVDKEMVSVMVGDAMMQHPPPCSSSASSSLLCYYDVICSVFGLQQLPDPMAAVVHWVNSLRLHGVAVILFWQPGKVEQEGPWARMKQVLQNCSNTHNEKQVLLKHHPSESKTKEQGCDWDETLVQAACSAGAKVVEDCIVSHDIKWDNPEQFWEGMTRSGPWNTMRLKRGNDFMDGLLREEFCKVYPSEEPIVHKPSARLLVLVKTE